MNPLLTTSEVQAGDLLATIDGTEYRSVVAIYKLNGNGVASFYCSGADWAETPPAIHARYQAEIDRLEEELAAARAAVLDAKSALVVVEDVPAGFACPHCPKVCQNRAGLTAHIRMNHKAEK